MHIDKGIDKQIVLSSYSGLLFSITKGCTADTCNSMDRSQKHMLSERSESQKSTYFMFVLYDSIYEVQEQA